MEVNPIVLWTSMKASVKITLIIVLGLCFITFMVAITQTDNMDLLLNWLFSSEAKK